MGISLEIYQGAGRDFLFQLAGATAPTDPWTLDHDQTTLISGPPVGVASGSFLATDMLAASVWDGANETTLLAPACTWSSAPNSQMQISLQNADMRVWQSASTTSRRSRPGPEHPRDRLPCCLAGHRWRSSPRRGLRSRPGRPTLF